MIALSLGAILTLFVCMPLLTIAWMALIYNFRSMHRPARHRENIYECEHCGHVYAFARNRPMDRCPRCSNLNEAVRP
ncbi:MAG: hypothetical protein HKP10_05440 [Kiritimatiellales bacterium]|nr:hypothetical protein [Kiritimatiellales bacterium]